MARRPGGRQARKAQRSAPLADAIKPVHPGESGGQFKPLTETDVAAVTENVFRILEEVGFADATPHCIETCTAAGAALGDDGRLRMPRSLVEQAMEQAPHSLVLHGQDPRHDLHIGGSKVH
ncbi:MAG: trimethylamine methyltransferase family protein, partial [Gammaproteobacteria bacterium]|nr:trimethylamine methyltransferase family protein [Gammaproteobacteria bacterium]